MSGKKVVGYSILAVLLLVGTYIYFWVLDFMNANIGISLAQAVDHDLGAWQFTVWVMACVLALILVFNGAASGHHDLEPISSACYLGFTIVSLFIGCSAVAVVGSRCPR
jgi:Ni,Fe-hydrogenase I cytochrome b subunit